MNKSTIQDCIAGFNTFGLHPWECDGRVYLRVNDEVIVQLSTAEVIFRADQYLEYKNSI